MGRLARRTRVAWQTTQPSHVVLPVSADWTVSADRTEPNTCPSRSFGGRIRSPFSLGPDTREGGTLLVWKRGARPLEMELRSLRFGRDE